MKTQAARTGMPFGTSGMLCEGGHLAPGFAAVVTVKQRRRRDTSIKHSRLVSRAGFDVPDAFELQAGAFRKSRVDFGGHPSLPRVWR
jgi:hypothetical protein